MLSIMSFWSIILRNIDRHILNRLLIFNVNITFIMCSYKIEPPIISLLISLFDSRSSRPARLSTTTRNSAASLRQWWRKGQRRRFMRWWRASFLVFHCMHVCTSNTFVLLDRRYRGEHPTCIYYFSLGIFFPIILCPIPCVCFFPLH